MNWKAILKNRYFHYFVVALIAIFITANVASGPDYSHTIETYKEKVSTLENEKSDLTKKDSISAVFRVESELKIKELETQNEKFKKEYWYKAEYYENGNMKTEEIKTVESIFKEYVHIIEKDSVVLRDSVVVKVNEVDSTVIKEKVVEVIKEVIKEIEQINKDKFEIAASVGEECNLPEFNTIANLDFTYDINDAFFVNMNMKNNDLLKFDITNSSISANIGIKLNF